ncbi:MAG: UxaA family hydrolase [Actinobacteria bacterium]|nr:UxaA family hydrolase [Actinomycetota bacterium]
MERRAILMKETDNVATALTDIPAGTTVTLQIGSESLPVLVTEAIPFGHKFAVRDIPKGADVIKYGQVMGAASAHIPQGAHAHVQNIESKRGRGDRA